MNEYLNTEGGRRRRRARGVRGGVPTCNRIARAPGGRNPTYRTMIMHTATDAAGAIVPAEEPSDWRSSRSSPRSP